MNLFRAPSRILSLAIVSCLAVSRLLAVQFVGHRGASHDAPENTVASARLGYAQQADATELDIHLSKDGRLVVLHDFDTKRITGRDAKVASLTLDEIRQLDAGKWKGPQFAGEKIPTLDEMIATVPNGKRLFVEIKIGPEIVPELAACLKRTGAGPEKIVIISFNFQSLEAVRRQLPGYETLWLVGYKTSPETKRQPIEFDELVRRCKAAGFDGLDLNYNWPLDRAAVRRLKAAGLQLHVWTIDDPAIARKWAEIGVDSITTNRPAWLREQLK